MFQITPHDTTILIEAIRLKRADIDRKMQQKGFQAVLGALALELEKVEDLETRLASEVPSLKSVK